jgi:chromate reductase
MNDPLLILGFIGSLRHGSFNRMTFRVAQELAPEGTLIEECAIAGLPGFNEDQEKDPPAQVIDMKKRIRQADAILFVTPEYNYSVPGVLKNAIDWASRPYGDSAWTNKPVAIMGASVGNFGTARAQYHLRQTFVFLNMYPVNQPEVMIGTAHQRFDKEGRLTDETSKKLIRQLLEELVGWTKKLSS